MKLAEDPIDRYKRLTATPNTLVSDELTPSALAAVMKHHPAGELSERLAEHVAQNSPLTVRDAKTVVDAALSAHNDAELRATAVSQALTAATTTAEPDRFWRRL